MESCDLFFFMVIILCFVCLNSIFDSKDFNIVCVRYDVLLNRIVGYV